MSDDKLVCTPGEHTFCEFHGAYHRVWPAHSLCCKKLETFGEFMDAMSSPPLYSLWDPAYLEDLLKRPGPVTGEP